MLTGVRRRRMWLTVRGWHGTDVYCLDGGYERGLGIKKQASLKGRLFESILIFVSA